MERSETFTAIAAALADFNKAIRNPAADQTARVQPKDHSKPAYTYPYADLGGIMDHVRPALAEAGLWITQQVVTDPAHPGDLGAETYLFHASGEWLRWEPVWIPAGDTAKEVGAAISYSRRYGVLAALGLAAREESDGPQAHRQAPRAQTVTPKAGPTPGAAPAAIGQARVSALIALANRKGKTAEELLIFAQALGLAKDKRLQEATPTLGDRIGRRLEGLPDRFDENGVEIPQAPAEQAELAAPAPAERDTDPPFVDGADFVILCSGVSFTSVRADKVLDDKCSEQRWFEVRCRGELEIARVASVTPWGARLVKVTLEDGRYFNVFRDHAAFIRGRL